MVTSNDNFRLFIIIWINTTRR